MNRFDGNTILIADSDKSFQLHLSSILSSYGATCITASDLSSAKAIVQKYDFDLVVANYHLVDGIILQLIDWCSKNLKFQPLFTCLSYPLESDILLCQSQSIACTFSKTDMNGMIRSLSNLLFDFNEYHQRLLEMITPEEIQTTITVGKTTYAISLSEITDESVFIDLELKEGTSGILKFSLTIDSKVQEYLIPGIFNGPASDGMMFMINKNYSASWRNFLKFLSYKQINVTDFINRAAGY